MYSTPCKPQSPVQFRQTLVSSTTCCRNCRRATDVAAGQPTCEPWRGNGRPRHQSNVPLRGRANTAVSHKLLTQQRLHSMRKTRWGWPSDAPQAYIPQAPITSRMVEQIQPYPATRLKYAVTCTHYSKGELAPQSPTTQDRATHPASIIIKCDRACAGSTTQVATRIIAYTAVSSHSTQEPKIVAGSA